MFLVVGDVMEDVIVRPDGPMANGTDRRASIRRAAGGSGANIACWLAHLGRRVRFAGRVGAPDQAAQIACFGRSGVEARLAADPELGTGSVVALIAPDGERSFFTDRGANLRLCADDLPPELLDGITALHVSGHTLCAPGPLAAALPLMERARAAGVAVSVDAGSLAWLREVGAASWAEATSWIPLCFANAVEAAWLGHDRGPGRLSVVTHGARGAEAQDGASHWAVEARHVEAIDSTGAGDAFVAGFLNSWLRTPDPRAALRAGCASGAEAVQTIGARPVR